MNQAMTFILALTSLQSTPRSQNAVAQRPATKCRLVYFVMINMSGNSREAHFHDTNTVITLPVAERVALQVPLGNSVEITSDTDSKVEKVIAISTMDEGRTIPIN